MKIWAHSIFSQRVYKGIPIEDSMGIPLQTRCENIEWAQIFMIRSSEKTFFIFYILELVYTSREK